MERHSDVIVAGGGLAGLAAAAYLARAGRRVTVLEKAAELGGRARTRERSGFLFNVGPHALYAAGQAHAVLRELEVPFTGQPPLAEGTFVGAGDRMEPLPAGALALLSSRLLTVGAKWELARVLARLPRLDASAADGTSLAEWLRRNVRHDSVAELLRTLFRVATFVDEPGRMSAGASLGQLQLALQKNVLYLDGGWQTLVDGLARRAREAGAQIVTRADVAGLELDGARVGGVRLENGDVWTAPFVLAALAPDGVAALAGLADDGRGTRVPVRMATLDLGLAHLPRPERRAVFGLGRPLYFSVHSAVARLAREGTALVHAAYYLGDDRRPPAAIEAELLEFVDAVQPGWRAHVIERRFVPELTVANAMPLAAAGGRAGRPPVAVAERPGLFVAGDWVGPEGLLADAALASARAAATAIVRAGAAVAAA
jgi:phytoene dehydrogenase-like protein